MRLVRASVAAALLALSSASLASAAPLAVTAQVNIASFAFAPASITINQGDSVRWTNMDAAAHSARSTTDAFNTGTLSGNQSATVMFNNAGTFPYICGIHGASMSGTVVVRAVTTPTLQPTSPPTAPPTPTPTAPPTTAPTVAPTTAAPSSGAPSPSAAPSAAGSPSAAASPSTSAAVAVGSPPAATQLTAAASSDAGPGPVFVALAAVLVAGLLGLAIVLARRT